MPENASGANTERECKNRNEAFVANDIASFGCDDDCNAARFFNAMKGGNKL